MILVQHGRKFAVEINNHWLFMSNLLLSKNRARYIRISFGFLKQTKEVKLFMTLLVKNEEGMLERESTVP